MRKAFGQLVAVDSVSFEARPGETLGLLGPNGAGKTTTIHLLVGLLRPDAGEIRIDDAAEPTRPEVRRKIGLAPQSLSLYDDMTAAENLAFFGQLYGLKSRALTERVAAALARAGLSKRGHDLVKTYSAGMKRRLHLAVALIHDPPVLLLDEPTIGVDPQARHHILADIASLKRQGRTIIFTTHYMDEAQRLCDRVAIMDHGRILAMDTVGRMIERYGGRTTVLATLDQSPPDAARLPGHLDQGVLSIETDQPFEAIKQLAATGLSISSLTLQRPSLETVFLQLTGRRLRD